jgi:CheY-like chemotaxis protein
MIEINAKEKGIRFETVADSSLPCSIIGDEHRLTQILLNLLGNAVKFTDHGHVIFRISNCGIANGRLSNPKSEIRNLEFEISDTGPGISEDRLEEIFSPFVQVGDHTRKRKGTGLGLAISCRLVDLMGGSLTVESAEGRGSTFRCALPFPLPNPSTSSIPKIREPKRLCGYTGARRTIMIADDNARNRTMLVDLLHPLGFIIKEAVNGLDALNQLEDMGFDIPDLLILDLVMPRLEGTEVVRRVRRWQEFQALKIIAVSANASFSAQAQLAERGCDDFLPKPIRVHELLDRLSHHLDLEWTYDTSSASGTDALPFVFPPQKDLEVLIEFAKGGYVTDMRKALNKMKESDPRLKPFVAKLNDMTNAFQFTSILDFLKPAMREKF